MSTRCIFSIKITDLFLVVCWSCDVSVSRYFETMQLAIFVYVLLFHFSVNNLYSVCIQQLIPGNIVSVAAYGFAT